MGRAGGGRCDLGRLKRRPPRPAIGPTPPRRPAAGGGETRRGRAARWLNGRPGDVGSERPGTRGLGPPQGGRAAAGGTGRIAGASGTARHAAGARAGRPGPAPCARAPRPGAAAGGGAGGAAGAAGKERTGHEWPWGRVGERPGCS